MICKKCGNELKTEDQFCSKCGSSIENQSNKATQSKIQKKKMSPGIIVLIVIGILMLIGFSTSLTVTNNTASTSSKVSSEQSNISVPEKKYININETISGKNWEISINDAYISQRIDPPEKSGYYNYYQVSDTDNTYLCIILNAKNISNLELKADKVSTVKALYDNNYTYSSFSAIPDKNLGFTYTSITNIKPLTNNLVYYLIEVPKIVETETDKPLEIEIKLDNSTFYYKYR